MHSAERGSAALHKTSTAAPRLQRHRQRSAVWQSAATQGSGTPPARPLLERGTAGTLAATLQLPPRSQADLRLWRTCSDRADSRPAWPAPETYAIALDSNTPDRIQPCTHSCKSPSSESQLSLRLRWRYTSASPDSTHLYLIVRFSISGTRYHA